MSMDASGVAVSIDSEYSKLLEMKPFPGPNYLLDFMAAQFDSEFQKAVPTEVNIDISTPAGSLTFPVDAEEAMPDIIGQQCADYWSNTVEVTGDPVNICTETPSKIVKVSNDASKIGPIIAEGMRALGGSDVPLTPHYLGFCDVIINAVKSIEWTVNEEGTNPVSVSCKKEFTVKVS